MNDMAGTSTGEALPERQGFLRALARSQRAFTRGRERRTALVLRASQYQGPDGPISVYAMAKAMGVDEKTVRAILAAATKQGE